MTPQDEFGYAMTLIIVLFAMLGSFVLGMTLAIPAN